MPGFIEPCLATLGHTVPIGLQWAVDARPEFESVNPARGLGALTRSHHTSPKPVSDLPKNFIQPGMPSPRLMLP
jgi:hypothetical protein